MDRLVRLSFSLFLLAGAADAAHARVLPGSTVRIALPGGAQRGVGLRGDARGWTLSVGGNATTVVFTDVVASTHERWVLPVSRGALVLDPARFVGGHAYRVEVRRGAERLDEGYVWLRPLPRSARSRVSFDVADSGSGDELSIVPKSAL